MCGFTGFLDSGHVLDRAEALAAVERMANAIAHRGPDDAGNWCDESVGLALGHRRLSILDLSPAGHQPMVSFNGRYVLAFNGEIYNHQDIRHELTAAGAAPRWLGHSDTETILAAVSCWGLMPAVKRMTGMFAFALWDREARVLYLVRDRLGEKPLYYGRVGQTFLFGSELKALRAHPYWRGDIDRGALTLLLRYNYIPAPYSIYQGVQKLLPGIILALQADGAITETRYWSARDAAERGNDQPFAGSETEATAMLEHLLSRSVGRQMIADVPLGAFLSGGIDSSVIVALMQAQSGRPVKTFTIGFHEADYNEAEHAKAVAHHLGTEHTELYVSAQQALEVIPRLPNLYDEPFSDSSQIPTFLVAQLARQHVTVSLSGDGGDELFGGYNRYFLGRSLWRKTGWLPRVVRGSLAAAIDAVTPASWNTFFTVFERVLPRHLRYANPGDKLHKLAEILAARDGDELYRGLVSHWKDPSSLVPGAREPTTVLTDHSAQATLADLTQRMMYLDLVSYLPDDILVKVDRAAMGVSLETRVPMLDHELVEFAWRVPLSMKIRDGQGKWLLRQVLYRHVPRELIERPKMGFGVPIDVWLRGPLRDWAEALLDEGRLKREGYFDPAPIRTKWQEHLVGRRNWQHHLWDVLMFQSWLENSRG